MKSGVLAKYREFLPINASTPMITLGEGDTPLVRSQRLEQDIGCRELYFKLEGCNPTGSFKDRGMVVAVAKAVESKSRAIICASTGNTSASAAAYGALCGLETIIVVPKGKIAVGKLAQAIVYGAKIVAVDGNFDQALQVVRGLVEHYPVILVNSVNPHRIEGQKTSSFEIISVLRNAPDYLFIPLGNAGNITAYWKGFKEFHQVGKAKKTPKMMAFEAEGAAAIVRGHPIENPETIATAIRIGNPASWDGAVAARDESGGMIDYVSDDQILEAYGLLASKEGVFGEPASAASVAGLIKLSRSGMDFSGKKIVCIITGNGLKDPDTAVRDHPSFSAVSPDLESIVNALGWS
ncbi:MAG: threonine synthase [Chloroflexota bacterium]|nr:threonine synthase [Chloroflexota bacterium]